MIDLHILEDNAPLLLEIRVCLELKKLKVAVKYGADTVMDLSIGHNISEIRSKILGNSPIPVGTVPIYEIAVNAQKRNGDFLKFGADDMVDVLESQAREGVDFFTIHAGVTRSCLALLKKHRRALDIVSRGGAIIASWINRHKKENPLYEYFDKILDIAYVSAMSICFQNCMYLQHIQTSGDSWKVLISQVRRKIEYSNRVLSIVPP